MKNDKTENSVASHGYASFDEWYQEIEVFGLRAERLTSDVNELRAAFDAGRTEERAQWWGGKSDTQIRAKLRMQELADTAAAVKVSTSRKSGSLVSEENRKRRLGGMMSDKAIVDFLEMQAEMEDAQRQADAVNAMLRGYAQSVTVVCGEDRETAIYLNGELQDREDSNDAYEIARITKSLPCRVTTRNPVGWQCGKNWPQSLLDVPSR